MLKNGRMGVGTAAPFNQLHVQATDTGTISTVAAVARFSNGTSFGVTKVIIGTDNSHSDGFITYTAGVTASNELMTLGSTSAIKTLSIKGDGNVIVKGNLTDTGNGLFTGTVSADSLYSTRGFSSFVGSFACSSFANATFQAAKNISYSMIGNTVYLTFNDNNGSSAGADSTTIKTLPLQIRPRKTVVVCAPIATLTGTYNCLLRISTNGIMRVYDNTYGSPSTLAVTLPTGQFSYCRE